MTSNHDQDPKTLVTVFDEINHARDAVLVLFEIGFGKDRVELISHDVLDASPDIETPSDHEITGSVLVESAERWGTVGVGAGAAVGIIAAATTGFPGLALGMLCIGGLAAAAVGGISGIERAIHDDTVDLPTLDDYDAMVKNGSNLVVFRGTHAEVALAREALAKLPSIKDHVHPVHGHHFHEHPRHLPAR